MLQENVPFKTHLTGVVYIGYQQGSDKWKSFCSRPSRANIKLQVFLNLGETSQVQGNGMEEK